MSLNNTELQFENEVINYLTQIGGVKQWEYVPEINTTEQLWSNFKKIVEQNNRAKINRELSDVEFNQIKKQISDINTPYQAGQFLYGTNGVSQVEIYLDNKDKPVYLTIFDQSQVGGGSTVYQIVNQIQRPKIIDGKQNRRFDVTLLINGLPIIQIELKATMHTATEALNQMEQYIAEKQFSDIFSTLQVLVAMTPFDIRYMANTTLEKFNRAFAFNWQDEQTAQPIRSWKEFSDKVLSIPMAHELATRYMILDGTKNKESIKVMRSYQVYATKRVLDQVSKYRFDYGSNKLGYVWHTTGSGKTITSFKTAWLASRLPNIDKVIFLVDRIALTNQTVDAYRAYDPSSFYEGSTGVVGETQNVGDLHNKLTKKTNKNIIVTSIQKMSKYVKSNRFKKLDSNILFIVDEAHRSTGESQSGQGMLQDIRNAMPRAAWVGYTGTPIFEREGKIDGRETRLIFGDLIHAYTIKEAIADKNVLGFNVEFKETIKAPENPTEDDIDDAIKSSIYDTSEEHVQLVVKDIFDNWRQRSSNRKYNALFTVHVGGGGASIPRAMEYYRAMLKENENRPENDQLRIGISFSADSSNSDSMLSTNNSLHEAIINHNRMFNTVFDMSKVTEYNEDLARRLNKTADDKQFLDLVIVVDRLLTGFDAPELNTLYIDRTLKGQNLIQAYSRTNRIHNPNTKPWGNVVNYRWPEQNEKEMKQAFATYSNRQSANYQLSDEEITKILEGSGIVSRPFVEVKDDLKDVIKQLDILTSHFINPPASEQKQDETFELLKQYNRLMGQLKQYTKDENDNPISAYDNQEEFYKMLGITEDQEIMLTVVIAEQLKGLKATKENIDISQVDLEMIHVHDVKINYDYLVELIAKMAEEVQANKMDEAKETKKEIELEIAKSESENERRKMSDFTEKVFSKEYTFNQYPVTRDVDTMNAIIQEVHEQKIIEMADEFINYWGLENNIKPKGLIELIKHHKIGEDDLDRQGEINVIMNLARGDYQVIAEPSVRALSWIKYRAQFREAIRAFADQIKREE